MISSIDYARKTLKWYIKKFFFHLLDITTRMLNAHNTIHMIKPGKKCKLEKIVVEAIRQRLREQQQHGVERPAPGRHSLSGDPTHALLDATS